jgi:hypothetical protein
LVEAKTYSRSFRSLNTYRTTGRESLKKNRNCFYVELKQVSTPAAKDLRWYCSQQSHNGRWSWAR